MPQHVQEIQDKLTKGTVECMICYDMVRTPEVHSNMVLFLLLLHFPSQLYQEMGSSTDFY
uniref:Uncharacterized protein n=1 Tax=Nelumbo nucifera TaxID=4432 RepID=A0A822YDX7_NELNU|nr:TPA_asm: hypothetical protein HUJ06_009538 [Nelumbo nucifera]